MPFGWRSETTPGACPQNPRVNRRARRGELPRMSPPAVLPVHDASEPRAADRDHLGANPSATPFESTRQGASRQSRPWNPRAPGRRSIGRSRCNRDVTTAHARHDRKPLERLVATTSPRGPRSTGLGGRSEGSPRLTTSAFGPRSKGVHRSEQGSPAPADRRIGTRHPSAATEATTSRRHTRQRRPLDARALPPQATPASEPEGPSTATTRIGCSGRTRNAPARPAAVHRTRHVTTDPRRRGARTRCRHRIHATWFNEPAAVPRVTTDDATRPTQLNTVGVSRDTARSDFGRSQSPHTSHRETYASATARERNAPSE